jgi:hypothetical protein
MIMFQSVVPETGYVALYVPVAETVLSSDKISLLAVRTRWVYPDPAPVGAKFTQNPVATRVSFAKVVVMLPEVAGPVLLPVPTLDPSVAAQGPYSPIAQPHAVTAPEVLFMVTVLAPAVDAVILVAT